MKKPGKELNFSSVPIQLWYLPRWISILPEGAKAHFLFIAAITNEVNLGSEKALQEFLLKNKTKPLTSKAKLSLKNYNNLNSEKHVDRIRQKIVHELITTFIIAILLDFSCLRVLSCRVVIRISGFFPLKKIGGKHGCWKNLSHVMITYHIKRQKLSAN